MDGRNSSRFHSHPEQPFLSFSSVPLKASFTIPNRRRGGEGEITEAGQGENLSPGSPQPDLRAGGEGGGCQTAQGIIGSPLECSLTPVKGMINFLIAVAKSPGGNYCIRIHGRFYLEKDSHVWIAHRSGTFHGLISLPGEKNALVSMRGGKGNKGREK